MQTGADNVQGTATGFSPRQAAGARARLALRAEQAWGMSWTPRVEVPIAAPAGVRLVKPVAPAKPAVAVVSPARVAPGGEPRVEGAVFADPPPGRERRVELLRALDELEVRRCDRCPLCQGRTNTVFGEGDPEARLMFIGEGPGETEDQLGRPFVGRAGALLDKMIAGMGLRREQVYIANVVKCRPPNNRVPTAVEVETCTPYLHKQIEWIRPQAIVTLGLPATRHLLKTTLPMGKLRGRWSQWRGIRVMPTYHPAYLLRSYTEENRRVVWGDLQQVMTELGLRRPAAQRS